MEENEGIDLVYAWVNGNDPEWQKKHDAFTGKTSTGKGDDCKGRYFDNDELRYSLRSVEMYAPWIRKIFIVTDNQVPEWLDTSNPKIEIIDHKQIIPSEYLPTFNSVVIEHFLHRIPGLSERFLYANDDMFLNRPVTPEMFFASDGFPIVRGLKKLSRELSLFFKEKIVRRKASAYLHQLRNSARLVSKKYGVYYNWNPHHNIDSYLRSDYEKVHNELADILRPTLSHHLRSNEDYSRILYSLVPLAQKRAHLKYTGHDESFRLRIYRPELYAAMERSNPLFFCMNDSEHVKDSDRVRAYEFMKSRFPKKSSFEK